MRWVFLVGLAASCLSGSGEIVHSHIGQHSTDVTDEVRMECVGKKQQFDWKDRSTLDTDIYSPKSVNFHPDGSKYYVNSLEGCATVVYDCATNSKLGVIKHKWPSGQGDLWGKPSGYYPFTHYTSGQTRAFSGKPVESAFVHGGRYLVVTYYRRTFDINAQDPSALAVIDTRTDSVVRLMETGPIPKMLVGSHDDTLLAVTHWGDNTVGLIDISDSDPKNWKHLPPIIVGKKLSLNFPMDRSVDRDANSGLAMRGTVFSPDDRYLIIGCLSGPMQIVDVKERKHLGSIQSVYNGRHVVAAPDGNLYVSTTVSGNLYKLPIDSILSAIPRRKGKTITVHGLTNSRPGSIRTIELSPSGKYIFAAGNGSSQLLCIRAKDMKVISRIPCDSYPVGLGISNDGSMVVVTSQGKVPQGGGNAVNLFKITYANPEPVITNKTDSAQTSVAPIAASKLPPTVPQLSHDDIAIYVYLGSGAVLLLGLILLALRTRKESKSRA